MIETEIQKLIVALDANTKALIALVGKTSTATEIKVAPPVKVVAAPVKKPSKSEDEIVAALAAKQAAADAKADAAEEKKIAGVTPKSILDEMLKANLRNEAIALLASIGGATRASEIVAQGDEAIATFIAGAQEILLGA